MRQATSAAGKKALGEEVDGSFASTLFKKQKEQPTLKWSFPFPLMFNLLRPPMLITKGSCEVEWSVSEEGDGSSKNWCMHLPQRRG